MIPEDLRYTAEHEWVAPAEEGRVWVEVSGTSALEARFERELVDEAK